jgi:hypothetical protein
LCEAEEVPIGSLEGLLQQLVVTPFK